MSKMNMITKMIDSIKADPSLDVSEWKNTPHLKAGILEKMEIEDLNAIEIDSMPEPEEGEMATNRNVNRLRFTVFCNNITPKSI